MDLIDARRLTGAFNTNRAQIIGATVQNTEKPVSVPDDVRHVKCACCSPPAARARSRSHHTFLLS